jgi:hypothetical protein
MEGVLTEQPDTIDTDPALREIMETLMRKGPHFAPVTHLDAGKVLFYKLTPTWIRWGDFTEGQGSDEVFTEIEL